MKTQYFKYGDEAVEYLKSRDKKLALAIDAVGKVKREINPDLFSAVVHNILGQQVSTSAARTVIARVESALGNITIDNINSATIETIQSCGTTFKKAEYIKDFAQKLTLGNFDLEAVRAMDDANAIKALSELKGIGEWTAEMLLLFSLNRMDIFSYKDLGIHRGIRMVYHHRVVTRDMWEKYRRRFSPYGSVASLYFWAISHMDVPGYDRDFATKKKLKHKF